LIFNRTGFNTERLDRCYFMVLRGFIK